MIKEKGLRSENIQRKEASRDARGKPKEIQQIRV